MPALETFLPRLQQQCHSNQANSSSSTVPPTAATMIAHTGKGLAPMEASTCGQQEGLGRPVDSDPKNCNAASPRSPTHLNGVGYCSVAHIAGGVNAPDLERVQPGAQALHKAVGRQAGTGGSCEACITLSHTSVAPHEIAQGSRTTSRAAEVHTLYVHTLLQFCQDPTPLAGTTVALLELLPADCSKWRRLPAAAFQASPTIVPGMPGDTLLVLAAIFRESNACWSGTVCKTVIQRGQGWLIGEMAAARQ